MSQDNSMYMPLCVDEEEGTVNPVKKAEADKISGELLDAIDYLDASTFPTQQEIEDVLWQIEKIYGK